MGVRITNFRANRTIIARRNTTTQYVYSNFWRQVRPRLRVGAYFIMCTTDDSGHLRRHIILCTQQQALRNRASDGYNGTEYTRLLPTYKTVERYTGKTLEQAVIYENDQNITVEVYVNGQWVDVSTIATPDQLPTTDNTYYRVKRGYTTIDVPDITQTVIDTVDQKIVGITSEYIPYVKLRITKVTVTTDERHHVIPTDETNVRRTDTAQRIHIEYEVTNATDVQAMMKDKTSDEDALKQLITPKPKGE